MQLSEGTSFVPADAFYHLTVFHQSGYNDLQRLTAESMTATLRMTPNDHKQA